MRASRLGGGLALFVLLLTASLGQAATLLADDVPPGKSPIETALQADLVGIANPEGFSLVVGAYRRWISEFDKVEAIPSSYLQAGTMLSINPAYAQGSVYGEWMPALFAQFRLQYDLYGFFGASGALLSFPSATSRFGNDEIDALKDQEESGVGHRIFLQPTLRGKVGPVYLRNQTDLGYYWFDARGPYYFEREYDTLLKSGDLLAVNRTHALFEAWKGRDSEILLAGPFYEVTHAADASITRQRLGAAFYWVPMERVWSLSRPRFYAEVGYNMQDRNRGHQAFAVFGIGFDYDLLK
jgi:hypothetical protein